MSRLGINIRCMLSESRDEGLAIGIQLLSRAKTAYNGRDNDTMPVWSYALLTEKKNGPWTGPAQLRRHVCIAAASVAEKQIEEFGDSWDPDKVAHIGGAVFDLAVEGYRNEKIKDRWYEIRV